MKDQHLRYYHIFEPFRLWIYGLLAPIFKVIGSRMYPDFTSFGATYSRSLQPYQVLLLNGNKR